MTYSYFVTFDLKRHMRGTDTTVESVAKLTRFTRRTVISWRARGCVPRRLRARLAAFFSEARSLVRGFYRHHMQAGIGAVYARANIGPARLYLPMRPLGLTFTLRRCDAAHLLRAKVLPGVWWGRWIGDDVEWTLRRVASRLVLTGRRLPWVRWPLPTTLLFAT